MDRKLILSDVTIGILIFIISFALTFFIFDKNDKKSWVKVNAIVVDYSNYLEDTVMDFNACYKIKLFIPTENRFIDFSDCKLIGTLECFTNNILYWMKAGGNCLSENTPNLIPGEIIPIRYNPSHFDWIYFP